MDGSTIEPKTVGVKPFQDVVATVHEAPTAPPESATQKTQSEEVRHEINDSRKRDIPSVNNQPTHTSGPVLAVVATVVVVLGLGALITYAYLRTQGIAVF